MAARASRDHLLGIVLLGIVRRRANEYCGGGSAGVSFTAINLQARREMPYQREAAIVLEMWREVERALQTAVTGTDEAESLQADAARLRDEYQRLIEAAAAHHRPVPPPFPGDLEADRRPDPPNTTTHPSTDDAQVLGRDRSDSGAAV